MHQPKLPDIQNGEDTRGLLIDEVGISGVRYPLTLPLRDGGTFSTVATIAMGVELPPSLRGTHMSRFAQMLNEDGDSFNPMAARQLLTRFLERLEANVAFVSMDFPIFLPRTAPSSGKVGQLDYDCTFRAVLRKTVGLGEPYEELVGITAPVTSLCPCSKEIADYGAHNQRSSVSIYARPCGERTLWFESLIEVAEAAGSCPVFPILKRADERVVTMAAYDNPRFVEDIVREAATKLQVWFTNGLLNWFMVTSVNHESIHNHDAFARIEAGTRGPICIWR